MALCVGVMKYKNCKCRRRTWLLTTGTAGANATLMAGSAGEIRLCMDTSPAWWAERAIRWMTRYDSRLSRRPARVYVCRVRMICAFCISAAVLRAVFSCIVTVYALWCSQKIESDSRDSACEPAPSRCYAPRSHMHTGASGHATHRCLYTLGGAGKGIPNGGTRRKGERVESAG
jgi:hypothetical protein